MGKMVGEILDIAIKEMGTTNFVDRKEDKLWLFYEPNGDFNRPDGIYYDDRMKSTRSKLFKLIKKIKKVYEGSNFYYL